MYFLISYSEMIKNLIEQLNANYSSILKRFSIIDNLADDHTPLPPNQNSLQLLIAKIDEKVNQGNTKREDERASITQLTNELRSYINADVLEMRHATCFLLGAVIHRMFRLKAQYEKWNKNLGQFWSVDNCGLYKIITDMLGINDSKKSELDVVTIVTSLKIFRVDMLKEIDKPNSREKIPRYKNYEHLAKDKNFIKHLDALIEKYTNTQQGMFLLPQFYAINFMESLAFKLELDRKSFEKVLSEWFEELKKELKFNQTGEQEILKNLDVYFQKQITLIPKNTLQARQEAEEKQLALMSKKNYIIELISNIDLKTIENYEKLFDQMNQENMNRNRCILCGGYSLFVQEGKRIDKILIHQMYKLLGLKEEITPEEQLGCINFLLNYVQKKPFIALNYEYFGNRNHMVSKILNLSTQLDLELKKKPGADKLVEIHENYEDLIHNNSISIV